MPSSPAVLIQDEIIVDGIRQLVAEPADRGSSERARWLMASMVGPELGLFNRPPWLVYIPAGGTGDADYRRLTFDSPPPPALAAFVSGVMPAPVFADWLEEYVAEKGIDLPEDAFNILRGWAV